MRKLMAGIAVAMLLLMTVGAEATGLGELQGKLILTTPSMTCGEWTPVTWTNDGPPIRIKATTFWLGEIRGYYAGGIMRSSDSMMLHYYTTETGNAAQSYGDNWISLGSGDALILWGYCAPPASQGRMGVHLLYLPALFQ
jgi:hypothetical protein